MKEAEALYRLMDEVGAVPEVPANGQESHRLPILDLFANSVELSRALELAVGNGEPEGAIRNTIDSVRSRPEVKRIVLQQLPKPVQEMLESELGNPDLTCDRLEQFCAWYRLSMSDLCTVKILTIGE
jgi:hypothetical protein